MFILFVLVVLVWLVLAGLLTGWSMWFQSAIYTEPATGVVWRAPLAASAMMLVMVVWVVLAYRMPGRFEPFWESTSSVSSKPFAEMRVPGPGGREEVYKRLPNNEYRLNGQTRGKRLPSTPSSIIVIEDGERYTFEPELDEKGHFKRRKVPGGDSYEPLRYRDEKGRVMTEDSPGRCGGFNIGLFAGNVMLHLALLGSAFLGLWLLVRFQWAHALGQAVVLCLLLLLFVLPQLLTRAETTAAARHKQTAQVDVLLMVRRTG